MLHVSPSLKGIVQKQLEERGARTLPSERPLTTVKGKALVDLQFRAQVEGHSFISDERESSGGHDAGPAPMRYFLASIMFCHQVWTVKSAALNDVQMDRFEAEISGYNDPSSGRGGFARIVYKVSIDSKRTDDEVRTIVEEGTRRCGAFRMAARATLIELKLDHNGRVILEKTYQE